LDSLIFDIDGTIWDITYLCSVVYNTVYDKWNRKHPFVTAGQLHGLFGKPVNEVYDTVFRRFSEADRIKIRKECLLLEDDFLKKRSPQAYDGLVDALAYLQKKYCLCIASNCQEGYIDRLFDCTGIGIYFTDTICFADTGLDKAENITAIMKRNHLKSSVYVGDTESDERAAKEAGIPFVFAEYGFGKAVCPDYTIRSPLELKELF